MGFDEKNLGRIARREAQRRQRRSIFATALIGATLTAVLAATAAFRIDDGSASSVRVVTTTTSIGIPTTTTTEDQGPATTLYENGSTIPPEGSTTTTQPTTTTTPTTAPAAATTTSAATTTTVPPVTSPPTPPSPARVDWHLTPAARTIQSGAQTTYTVSVTNVGGSTGAVIVPECPARPKAFTRASALYTSCQPGAPLVQIRAGQTLSWTYTVSATDDATRYGHALAPGNYVVLVNNGPIMFLVLHVTA